MCIRDRFHAVQGRHVRGRRQLGPGAVRHRLYPCLLYTSLEQPSLEPQYNKPGFLELGVSPEQAPDTPTYVKIHFEKGIPKMCIRDRVPTRRWPPP